MTMKNYIKTLQFANVPRNEISFDNARIVLGIVGKMRNINSIKIYDNQLRGLCKLKDLPNGIVITVLTSNGSYNVEHVNTKVSCCLPLPIASVPLNAKSQIVSGAKIKIKITGLIINPNNYKTTKLF
jgi:hypothetical protein